jgi:FixJ family two-component response regulator
MKSVGFKVEAFASAEDFLLASNLYDTRCLLLDVRLPGMSGLDLQRRLAAHHHIPIIFVSAHDEQEAWEQALRAGAVAFLSKPFSEEALLSGVHTALQSLNVIAYVPVISSSQR